jgi:SAM-dependent methyltransferase
MAVLWSQWVDANHYEVRQAGASLRLYRNGVNHSQWNPNRPLAGGIWDLIALPALFRPDKSLQEALILGFGAGSIAAQLKAFQAPKRIVGIDLDPIHLSIADGFFDCSAGCELVAGDAVEWVYDCPEEQQFDYILDDLYAEEAGLPIRCAPLDLDWCRALARLMRPEGILVFNLIEPAKIPHLPFLADKELRSQFPQAMQFSLAGYENRILAISRSPLNEAVFQQRVRAICRAHPRCYGVSKRYQMHSISTSVAKSLMEAGHK